MEHPTSTIVQAYRPIVELVPAHWQMSSIITADGTHIHYTRTGGTKPALLLLHGFQVNGLMWLRTAKALEADYDIVMPDFRGHGGSGDVSRGFSSEMLVNDTLALIEALGIEAGIAAFENNWCDGQHIHFANSGHFIMFDQFEAFIEALSDFLK